MKWWTSVALIVVVSFFGCSKPNLTLRAPPGEFRIHDIGAKSETASLSVRLTLAALDRHPEWPPAAYVGFYEGEDRNNSIQFVLIQNDADDDYLVAGYRIIEDGLEAKVVALDTIREGRSVEVSMAFASGVTTIAIKDGSSGEEQTKLKVVTPYVSVSSGTATFEVVPLISAAADSG